MTRWPDCFFFIRSFSAMKICPIISKIAKVDSAFCQVRNKLSKICQRLVNVCKSGEFSPNLVTLPTYLPSNALSHTDVHLFFGILYSSKRSKPPVLLCRSLRNFFPRKKPFFFFLSYGICQHVTKGNLSPQDRIKSKLATTMIVILEVPLRTKLWIILAIPIQV